MLCIMETERHGVGGTRGRAGVKTNSPVPKNSCFMCIRYLESRMHTG